MMTTRLATDLLERWSRAFSDQCLNCTCTKYAQGLLEVALSLCLLGAFIYGCGCLICLGAWDLKTCKHSVMRTWCSVYFTAGGQ